MPSVMLLRPCWEHYRAFLLGKLSFFKLLLGGLMDGTENSLVVKSTLFFLKK